MRISRTLDAIKAAADKVTIAASEAEGSTLEAKAHAYQLSGFVQAVMNDVGDAARQHQRAARAAEIAFYVIGTVVLARFIYESVFED